MWVTTTPNDPKLSDCGARRAGCGKAAGAGWAKVAGWCAAASVTRGAVRCSAWLGVAAVGNNLLIRICFCINVAVRKFLVVVDNCLRGAGNSVAGKWLVLVLVTGSVPSDVHDALVFG